MFKDYDTIDWSEIFTYSEDSPSGLVWKNHKYLKGKIAGCKHTTNRDRLTAKTHTCWRVTYKKDSYYVHRIIACIKLGSVKNLEVDHIDLDSLNNKIENLRLVTSDVNLRNFPKKLNNTSGVTGVGLHTKRGVAVGYVASWYEVEGLHRATKEFSISKYGLLPAFAEAVKYRKKMIEELNTQGAGYSENHGLDKVIIK